MRIPLLVAILMLAGCNATVPQQPRVSATDDPTLKCFGALASDPMLAPIAGKVSIANANTASIEMLSSTERPTQPEKQALSYWGKARMDCVERGRGFRSQYAPPAVAAAIEQGQLSLLQAIATLYGGGTYGQFNADRQRLNTQMTANINAALNTAREQGQMARQAAQQADAAQMNQTLMLMQAMQPRPMLPMPSPSVICTSRPGAGGVTTVCQ